MKEKQFQEEVLTRVFDILKDSDADYILVTNRKADNGMIAANFGCRTEDGFAQLAHTLVGHASTEDGVPVRSFINALLTEVSDRLDIQRSSGQQAS